MAEYIEREALLHEFDIRSYSSITWQSIWNRAACMVSEQPAANVMPVVRCKNCKHCEQGLTVYGKKYFECRCEGFLGEHIGVPVFPNDFCSYGERREGE